MIDQLKAEIQVDDNKLTDIITHLTMNWDETQNIPTKSLNVNGKVVQDSMDTYLSQKGYYSSSALKEVMKSPFHLKYYLDEGMKEEIDRFKKESPSFELGTFIHEAILEPTKFNRMIAAPSHAKNKLDEMDKGIQWWQDTILNEEGKETLDNLELKLNLALEKGKVDESKLTGKKFIYSFYERNTGLSVIPEEYFAICKIIKSWYFNYGNGVIPRLLKHSKREVSVYDDQNFMIPLRIRPDAMLFEENVGRNVILSVKSTRSPYPRKFFMDYASFEYPLSDAMYNEVASKVTGRNFDTTLCVMVQNTAPYGVGLFMIKQEDLETAKYKFHHAMSTVKECEETGLYPGFEALAERGNMGISFVQIPGWYAQDLFNVDLHD